jgi:hypothetical protein
MIGRPKSGRALLFVRIEQIVGAVERRYPIGGRGDQMK